MSKVTRFRFYQMEHTPSRHPTLYYRNEFLRGAQAEGYNIVLVSFADVQNSRSYARF